MLLILELRFWNSEFGFGIRHYNEWKILIIACKIPWFCSDFHLMNCVLFEYDVTFNGLSFVRLKINIK
ncbi:TPA: hypothetical protein PQI62_002171 [Staphylococcus aureus]|nr:hypothetical protein [Staphylococcus aureus]